MALASSVFAGSETAVERGGGLTTKCEGPSRYRNAAGTRNGQEPSWAQ